MTLQAHSVGIRFMSFFSGVGVASLILLLTGLGNTVTYLSGVMAMLFIGYGLIAAKNSERVKTKEDREALNDVHALVKQCVKIAEKAARLDIYLPEDMSRALAYLAAKTSLLVTRYGKYIEPETLEMIRESERMVVDVHMGGDANPQFLEALLWRLQSMHGGIRDIDHPDLHTARRSI